MQDYVLPRVDRVIVFGRAQLDHLRAEYGSTVKVISSIFEPTRISSSRRTKASRRIVRTSFSVGLDGALDFTTFARAAQELSTDGDRKAGSVEKLTSNA
jgi:hypothetical protein